MDNGRFINHWTCFQQLLFQFLQSLRQEHYCVIHSHNCSQIGLISVNSSLILSVDQSKLSSAPASPSSRKSSLITAILLFAVFIGPAPTQLLRVQHTAVDDLSLLAQLVNHLSWADVPALDDAGREKFEQGQIQGPYVDSWNSLQSYGWGVEATVLEAVLQSVSASLQISTSLDVASCSLVPLVLLGRCSCTISRYAHWARPPLVVIQRMHQVIAPSCHGWDNTSTARA